MYMKCTCIKRTPGTKLVDWIIAPHEVNADATRLCLRVKFVRALAFDTVGIEKSFSEVAQGIDDSERGKPLFFFFPQ